MPTRECRPMPDAIVAYGAPYTAEQAERFAARPQVADPRNAIELLEEIRRTTEKQKSKSATVADFAQAAASPEPLLSADISHDGARGFISTVASARVNIPTTDIQGFDNAAHYPDPGEPPTAPSMAWGRLGRTSPTLSASPLSAGRRCHAYRMAADAVDQLIALMDALKIDTEDMEEEEPSGTNLDSGAGDDANYEPSIEWPEDIRAEINPELTGEAGMDCEADETMRR